MTRLRSSLFFALSLSSFAAGCGGDENVNPKPSDNEVGKDEECDAEEVGEDCTCDDDAEGVYECNKDDELECVCEEQDESPSTDDEKDAGKDAGKDAKAPEKEPVVDATVKPPEPKDAGTDASKGGDDAGPMVPNPMGGQAGEPTIPAVSGECPEFRNGTVAIAGHRGVNITAGAAGKGGAILFYWHGTGGSAAEVNRSVPAAVRNEIIAGGGIIASFNGSQSAKTGSDCSGTGAHNQSDFAAADQIVACGVKNHGIDPHRIYTTGCSAGGLQSGCMATLRSSYVAAAAPNSGGIVFPLKLQDKHVPALFSMHGGPSDVVIVTFSETSASLNKQFKTAGGFVVNCNHGGGHCAAPGGLQTAAWKFMNEHPFGVSPEPWSSIPSGVPDYCKVF